MIITQVINSIDMIIGAMLSQINAMNIGSTQHLKYKCKEEEKRKVKLLQTPWRPQPTMDVVVCPHPSRIRRGGKGPSAHYISSLLLCVISPVSLQYQGKRYRDDVAGSFASYSNEWPWRRYCLHPGYVCSKTNVVPDLCRISSYFVSIYNDMYVHA